jgi:hypothetical protein
MNCGYFPIIQLGIENLITVLFNNLKDELFLTGSKERNTDSFIFCLEDILLYDVLIHVTSELFLDKDLKLLKVTEFYLFLYNFLMHKLDFLWLAA